MSHALDRPDAALPTREPIRLRRALSFTAAATVFGLTFTRLARSRRTVSLVLLYLLPIGMLLMIRNTAILAPAQVELQIALMLFPHTLLPLSALLYAPGLIQDEVEEQTLTYLLIRPIPRWLIVVAKLAASIALTALLASAFAVFVEVVIWWDVPGHWQFVPARAATLAGLFALAVTAYNALFAFVGLMVRKSLAFGIMYLIFFEAILANIDFVVRRLTVMFYFRNLAQRWLDPPPVPWQINLDTAPGSVESVATLLVATVVLAALSATVFTNRELRVKTPEAS